MPPSKPEAHELLARSLSPDDLPDPRHSLDLLALAQRGDTRALEELVGRYSERIRRIVRIQLGRSGLRRHYDSMDIVQSTFKAALPKIGELRPRSAASLLQWLSMIATNQIRDARDRVHADKRDARREVPLDGTPAESGDFVAPACAARGPDEAAMLSEIRELLDAEVTELPEDQRLAVVLRDYCGEDWDRIAVELGREKGAARQLHQRAWIRLRQVLRPRIEGRGATRSESTDE